MSLFGKRRRDRAPEPAERTLADWMALSMLTEFPKHTGNLAIDEWNHAIACVQAYLNGRATGTDSDTEREYLLRLRADLNWMHMSPLPEETDASGDDSGDDSGANEGEPDNRCTCRPAVPGRYTLHDADCPVHGMGPEPTPTTSA